MIETFQSLEDPRALLRREKIFVEIVNYLDFFLLDKHSIGVGEILAGILSNKEFKLSGRSVPEQLTFLELALIKANNRVTNMPYDSTIIGTRNVLYQIVNFLKTKPEPISSVEIELRYGTYHVFPTNFELSKAELIIELCEQIRVLMNIFLAGDHPCTNVEISLGGKIKAYTSHPELNKVVEKLRKKLKPDRKIVTIVDKFRG